MDVCICEMKTSAAILFPHLNSGNPQAPPADHPGFDQGEETLTTCSSSFWSGVYFTSILIQWWGNDPLQQLPTFQA